MSLKDLYKKFDRVRADRAKHVNIAEGLMAELRELKRQAVNANNDKMNDDEREAIMVAIDNKRNEVRAAKEPIFPLAREESELAKQVSGKPRPE